jgi:hypothetical protein
MWKSYNHSYATNQKGENMTDQSTCLRERRKWEDTLLHARSGIFLVINSFAVQKHTVLLAATMAAVNSLWILASFQSWIVISTLVEKYGQAGSQSVVDAALGSRIIHRVFRPTTLIALWVPFFVHFAWLLYMGIVEGSFWIWTAAGAGALLPLAVLLLLRLSKEKHNKPSGGDVQ